ncbi:MAG TPA: efflux RND transporter permease subunit [Thermoanaerobaculia bacterium]|nr:efflux RND transporter permease subunit [Thermoanaerobaculia bacterium]
MQKLAEICIRRPVFASMLILSLVVVGAASYPKLGVDRFPSVDLPTVIVRATLPGASPEEMESSVSMPLEEAVNTVQGIEELRSISGLGSSLLVVTFALNRDIDVATQDVRDRVNASMRRLPRDIDPPIVQKFDNDSTPVMTLALSADRSIRELTEIADKIVKPILERSAGVGEIAISGGLLRAIDVRVNVDRLAAYKIPITAVQTALQRQNSDVPGGNVDAGRREISLRTMGRFPEARAFQELVVAQVNGAPVRMSDIGTVEDGTKEQRSLSRLNGEPTVTLEVRRQSGANTIVVIEGVKKAMERAKTLIPADVRMLPIRDQSRFIKAALSEINVHLVLGSLFATLVVLVFMRNWRSTLIAAVAIPTSLVATFAMMRALNFTLNSVTMLALVLMVGVVIDDAIVVLENIFRFVEEKKMDSFAAAKAATADIGLAVLATTFSLVVIFLPVSFMSSISGRFLYQFGITASCAILVSLLVSFTLTPMMSARLLRDVAARHANGTAAAAGEEPASRRGFYHRLDLFYTRVLSWAMSHRKAVVVVAGAVVLSTIPIYRATRQELVPGNVDEAEFDVSIDAPEGMSLAAMDEAMREVERELLATRGVTTVLTTAGSSWMGNVNSGGAYVRLKPHEERVFGFGRIWHETKNLTPWRAFYGNYSQRDVMTEARRRLRKFGHLRSSVRNATAFNFGGGPGDIVLALRGPDVITLLTSLETIREKTVKGEIPGIVDANTGLRLDKPELRIRVDRDKAADLGVDVTDVATSLRIMVGGDDRVSRFRDDAVGQDYDVQLRLEKEDRSDAETISRLYVPSSRGGLVRLDNVVDLVEGFAPSRIERLDRQRTVRLFAGVAPGYALADRIEALRQGVAELNLPASYSLSVLGRGREFERTFKEFFFAFLLSIAFMYMILASQFESVIHPVTILVSLPLSVPFALFSLWAMSDTINLYSALGVLVLFGVVKKNAILQIDHMNNLRRRDGLPRHEAVMQANRDRLRPILMTTAALVAGMIPLALGTGPGAEERRSIAIVVIGGQTLSLLLTLLATPVFYTVFEDIAASPQWKAFIRKVVAPVEEAAGAAAARAAAWAESRRARRAHRNGGNGRTLAP